MYFNYSKLIFESENSFQGIIVQILPQNSRRKKFKNNIRTIFKKDAFFSRLCELIPSNSNKSFEGQILREHNLYRKIFTENIELRTVEVPMET